MTAKAAKPTLEQTKQSPRRRKIIHLLYPFFFFFSFLTTNTLGLKLMSLGCAEAPLKLHKLHNFAVITNTNLSQNSAAQMRCRMETYPPLILLTSLGPKHTSIGGAKVPLKLRKQLYRYTNKITNPHPTPRQPFFFFFFFLPLALTMPQTNKTHLRS